MPVRKSAAAVVVAVMAWILFVGGAAADDWVVDRLRGQVLVQTGDSWRELVRGDVVSDSSPIKSLDGSRVTFARGAERIELSGATEIRIFDRAGERMTTVMQAYGTVTVEAERLDVQHFSVQTPYLAAIVKGTRFTVVSGDGQSDVRVERGLVQVQDSENELVTDILPGQVAVVSELAALEVTGSGPIAPIVTFGGVLFAEDVEITAGPPDGGQGGTPSNSGSGPGGNGNNGGAGNGNNGNGIGTTGNGNNGNSGNNGNGNAGNGNGNNGNGNNGNGNNGNGNAGGGNNGNAGNGIGNGNAGNGNNGNGHDGKGNGSSGNSNGNGNGGGQ